MILGTGCAGFVGSNFVHAWLAQTDEPIVNLDKLTYAGNLENLRPLQDDRRHIFVRGDVGDRQLLGRLLSEHRPRAVVHFAAESHVDRSIHGPSDFIDTNVLGTFRLLESVREYWSGLPAEQQRAFRFLQVSTDEIYGSLAPDDPPFREDHPHRPNSPYAASKAAADDLVRAWGHTYGLPVLTTNCGNNYGPYQFPEKLIPLVIHNALASEPLPMYGDGQQVRDWLHVTDHCRAIAAVLERGEVGQTYNVGGRSERSNLELVTSVCAVLDELRPRRDGRPHKEQVRFVKDRPGHDRRYAIDAGKIERELQWTPAETLASGLRKTVQWYIDNATWLAGVNSGGYRQWVNMQYGLS